MNEMTPDEFRSLVLNFSEAVESAHMSHPDFRVSGRIFATLGYPDEKCGMVKLTPDEQANFIRADPDVFRPVNGAWGRRGYTNVHLPAAKIDRVREALDVAWRNAAPKRLIRREQGR